MEKDAVEGYKALISAAFPSVEVRGAGWNEGIDVFFVPDDKLHEFVEFRTEVLPDEVAEKGLPDLFVAGHTDKATREFYPEVWSSRHKETQDDAPVV